MEKKLNIAIRAAIEAGRGIMEIYENSDFQVEIKEDKSPLTIADKKANDIINSHLIPTNEPIISEENQQVSYEERKNWEQCWIVDPLDGTKEFIKKNGEFTVNIAFVHSGKPVLGVIFAPALGLLYFSNVATGKAYRVRMDGEMGLSEITAQAEEIRPEKREGCMKVVGSRSHMNEETLAYVDKLKKKYEQEIEIVSKGSSLKFCLVAEGAAQIYPRFAPTMEWDTAAGQAICEAVGLHCQLRSTGLAMTYNREDLLNGHFFVVHEG